MSGKTNYTKETERVIKYTHRKMTRGDGFVPYTVIQLDMFPIAIEMLLHKRMLRDL